MRSEAFRWFVRGTGFGLGAALVLAVLSGLWIAGNVVLIVFLALLLASGLQPIVGLVRGRTGLRRGSTVLLVYAGFFVIVIALALIVLPGAINQFNDLGAQLAPVLQEARAWAGTVQPRSLSAGLGALIDALQRVVAPAAPETPDPDVVIDVGVAAAELAVAVAALLALVFFWLTERARLQRFALALLPTDRRSGTRAAWNEIELRLGSWVRAQLILMGTVGVLTGIAYLLIGLEGAILLGLIAALAEAVPIVGPIIGAIPALLVAATTGQLETVLLVGVAYVVIQTVESNVLVPIVMRNTIGIPPFIVIASVLAGGAIGGVMGAVVAVPVTAALLVVAERMQVRRWRVPLERMSVDEDALHPDPTAGEELASAGGGTERKRRRA